MTSSASSSSSSSLSASSSMSNQSSNLQNNTHKNTTTTNALRSAPIISSSPSISSISNAIHSRPSANPIIAPFISSLSSSIPYIPSIPIMNTNSTHATQPIQMNGVQYILHPSTASTAANCTPSTTNNGAVPVIVVPSINLIHATSTNATAASSAIPPNDKIKQILEKKRKGKDPLNAQELKILEAAVQSARQQFLCWYQQQALRQSLLLNNNVLSNPNMQPPIAQALSTKQIALLQQRQLLQQQQMILQTQMANNNAWINNNNNNGSIPSFNPYATNGNNMNMNSNTNRFSSNYNMNTYNIKTNITAYFALPKAEEFDKVFYNKSKQKNDEDTISVYGVNDVERESCADDDDLLCFDMELEGLGTFQFGKQHAQNIKVAHSSRASETSKKQRDALYESLDVKDITNECCQWLVRDLMRSQSELKSNSVPHTEERCVTMTQLKHITTDVIPKQQMDRIIAQITRNPTIPHSVLYSKIYDVYCRKNSFIEISNVDISCVHIQLNENKPEKDVNAYALTYNIENILNDLEGTTLAFYNLCILTQDHFDPCKDVETLHIEQLSCDDVLYKTAQKLRDDPNYFKIPTLHSSDASPVDRKLFGTKLKNNNNNNQINNNNNNNTVIVTPTNNAKGVNITNNLINIGNITINNSTPNHVCSPVSPWNNIIVPTYNPLPVNPLTFNRTSAPSLIQTPIIYNLPNCNPYVTPQVNLNNARLVTIPTYPQAPFVQSPTKQQIKISSGTK